MRRVDKKKLLLKLMIAVVVLGIVVLALTELVDWPKVREWMQNLDRRYLLGLMAVLPLLGFSISLIYLVIGAVFGGPLGVMVVAGITAVHLLGSHWIGRGYLRKPLERWMEKRNYHLPELSPGEDASVALMAVLVPGPPYFVRNYLLAISGIPLRIYFWVCWPVYVLRSCLVIFIGDFSHGLSTKRIVILASVFVIKLGICAFLLHRLRARFRAKKIKKEERTPLQKRLARIGRME
ncbi:MAG: VTT domain-containing protein [Lacunisphaera sp.]